MTAAPAKGGPPKPPGMAQRLRQWLRRVLGRTRFDQLERLLAEHGRAREAAFQALKVENEGFRRRLEKATELVEDIVAKRLEPLTEENRRLHEMLTAEHQETRGLVSGMDKSMQAVKDDCVRAVAGQVASLREQNGELRSQLLALGDNLTDDTRSLGRELRTAVADGMAATGERVEAMVARMDGLEAQITESQRPLQALAQKLDEVEDWLGKIRVPLAAMGERVDALGPRLSGLRQQVVRDVLGPVEQGLDTLGERSDAIASRVDELQRSVAETHSGQLEEARQELAALQQAAAARDELEHELAGLREGAEALRDELAQHQETISTYRRWRDSMQVELDRVRHERDRLLRDRAAPGGETARGNGAVEARGEGPAAPRSRTGPGHDDKAHQGAGPDGDGPERDDPHRDGPRSDQSAGESV